MLAEIISQILNIIYIIFIIYSFINAVRLIVKKEISIFRGVILILIMIVFLSYFIFSKIAYIESCRFNNPLEWAMANQAFRGCIESFAQLFVIITGIRYLF